MQNHWLTRTETLLGPEKLAKLCNANVLIVGVGGVGSFAAEYIARAGISQITLVDADTIEITNRNRQLPALASTEGLKKAAYMAQRLQDIHPEIRLNVIERYISEGNIQDLFADKNPKYDYVIDAIDTVSPKIALISECLDRKIPLVSAMGAGGKLDPAKVQVADISKTKNCTLAQQVRKTLRKKGIKGHFDAVFSTELPDTSLVKLVEGQAHKKSYLGTISYMPSLFGVFCASVVIRKLILS